MWNAVKQMFGASMAAEPELEFARQKMAADRQEVGKRYVGCLLAISHEVDPGYRAQFARTAVSEWYGIGTRDELVRRIESYIAGGLSTPAYDAFRATFLARAGLAAGHLSLAESWHFGLLASQRVQQTYDGWLAYGMGYLQGHLDHRRSCGDDHAQIAEHRVQLMQRMNEQARGLWSSTPFRAALQPS